jgi:late competence protein required for DNA uptake (superfamily II DNA/RNA helicase)
VTVKFEVLESSAGHLHLLIEGDRKLACGRPGDSFQVVMGRRPRSAPFCRPCLSAVRKRVQSDRESGGG